MSSVGYMVCLYTSKHSVSLYIHSFGCKYRNKINIYLLISNCLIKPPILLIAHLIQFCLFSLQVLIIYMSYMTFFVARYISHYIIYTEACFFSTQAKNYRYFIIIRKRHFFWGNSFATRTHLVLMKYVSCYNKHLLFTRKASSKWSDLPWE